MSPLYALFYPRRSQGFTLIELLVTIGVAAILGGLAAPSIREFIANQRIRSASSDLITHITFARSEAIKQNTSITMASVSGTTAWQNGWTIADDDGNLKTQNPYTLLTITATATNVGYNRSGRSASGQVKFEVADSTPNSRVQPRCITVSLTGQPVAKTGSC